MRKFHRGILCAMLLLSLSVEALSVGMVELGDEDLGDVNAQGLLWTDRISGTELTGPTAQSTPFTFYRVGLEGELALNTNIARLQLGCGGINDFLNARAGCDIDIDYASLMGRTGSNPGNPGSAFVLKRPYMEFAIKNDGTANRELAGIKIGAQSADGAISAGRRYQPGQTNQESMTTNNCQGTTTGPGALGCHSGINSVSGFLGAEMSLTMVVNAGVCLGFVVGSSCAGLLIPLEAYGCAGRTQYNLNGEPCGTAQSDALFVDLGGTRMQTLGLRAAQLQLEGENLVGEIADALLGNAYASLNADLRLVHKLTFENTGDFFLSFQREPVAYPRFSKMTPASEVLPGAMDSCATTNFNQARCASAYSVAANTGWWLNAPSVKLLDVYNQDANLGTLTLGDALSLLAAPGYLIDQAEFNMTPSKNCYGSSRFC